MEVERNWASVVFSNHLSMLQTSFFLFCFVWFVFFNAGTLCIHEDVVEKSVQTLEKWGKTFPANDPSSFFFVLARNINDILLNKPEKSTPD